MTWILFALLFVLLFSTTPVYVSLGLASTIFITFFTSNIPMEIIPQRIFSGIDKFTLMAVPCFILAANIMKEGGLSARIIRLANVTVGHMRGGLAQATIVACMFFGAVSGSSPATVAAIGAVVYPALITAGYGSNFSAGLITSSAAVALIIPPSIGMIVYGTLTGVSVGALFIAGILPGVLFGLVFMVYTRFYAQRHEVQVQPRAPIGEVWSAIKEAAWALGIPLIIIVGIYGGVFTPTESAAVAAVYAIFVSMFIYKEMDLKKLFDVAFESAVGVAQIMILIAAATIFAWLLTRLQAPQQLGEAISSFSQSKFVILLLINLILLVSGMFLDPTSITLIFAPLFLPLVVQYGVEPLHLGVIMVVNSAIGMFTPPFGFNLFVAASVTKTSINRLVPGIVPFILLSLITMAIVTWVPAISTFLPSLLH